MSKYWKGQRCFFTFRRKVWEERFFLYVPSSHIGTYHSEYFSNFFANFVTNPEVPLSKVYQEYWGFPDYTDFKDNIIKVHAQTVKFDILEFSISQELSSTPSAAGPRVDCQDFVEFVDSFIGMISVRRIFFCLLGQYIELLGCLR